MFASGRSGVVCDAVSTPEPHPDRVPGAEYAWAADEKFYEYLLNEAHTIGRAKARYFRAIGYTRENWQELKEAFLAQLPVVAGRYSYANDFGGDNYEAVISVENPDGEPVAVMTIWEVHPDTGTKFLTAYPLDS